MVYASTLALIIFTKMANYLKGSTGASRCINSGNQDSMILNLVETRREANAKAYLQMSAITYYMSTIVTGVVLRVSSVFCHSYYC